MGFFKKALGVAKKAYSYTPAGFATKALTGDSLGGLLGKSGGGGKDDTPEQMAAKQSAISHAALQSGLKKGQKMGEEMMGTTQKQVGKDIGDVIKRRRGGLDRYSGQADAMRKDASARVRTLRAQGGFQGIGQKGQEREAGRRAMSDVANQRYQEQENNLQNFQSLMGNVSKNIASTKFGMGSLEMASVKPQMMPQAGGGILGGGGKGILGMFGI